MRAKSQPAEEAWFSIFEASKEVFILYNYLCKWYIAALVSFGGWSKNRSLHN